MFAFIRNWFVDLGISDLERPSTDYVKHGFMVHVDRSNYEGVGSMTEIGFVLVSIVSCGILVAWLVLGGEGDE